MAEGSFLIKKNLDACFQIKQRTHTVLFSAFTLLFDTTRTVGLTEGGKYAQLSVSSVKDIQTVINFFSALGPNTENAGVFTGHKRVQYEQ